MFKKRLFCKGCNQEIKKGHDLKDLKYCRGDLVHKRCYWDTFIKCWGDPFQDAGSDEPIDGVHEKNMRILGYAV
ncbi:MAG: hypothetical protein GTN76_04280 [Candidatus Aenigmarchaeota archaeon]|nr:hypothetical protein [Candidatus Aenigmarchaeota archaeon]